MKKIIVLIAVIFTFSTFLTSCKDTKKVEAEVESHEGHDHGNEETATNETYQCPMDCEKGKTYEETGSCPVCKMDLKAAKGEMQHADDCTCKADGECVCPEGKCECQSEIAVNAAKNDNCKAGSCSCKA